MGGAWKEKSVWPLLIRPWLLGSPARGKKGQAEARQRNPMSSMGHSEEWLLFESFAGAPRPWGMQWDPAGSGPAPTDLLCSFWSLCLGHITLASGSAFWGPGLTQMLRLLETAGVTLARLAKAIVPARSLPQLESEDRRRKKVSGRMCPVETHCAELDSRVGI